MSIPVAHPISKIELYSFESNNFSVDESLNDYEDNQKFIVFDKFEIRRMIDVLTYALCNCEGICYTDFDCMGG